MNLGDALQSVLTQGIDAVKSVKLAQLSVNNGVPQTSTTNGIGVPAGEGANGAGIRGVPSWVWMAGLAALGAVLILPRLLRK